MKQLIPEACVEDEQGSLERLRHIDPLSPEFDDYAIGCYIDAVQALNNV